ncbi:hypothetical protein LDVICp178 [lymphocystis disease virus-China]|uniref:Uncharacterized protein n=2 Tax=Lymphocystis disease virus 2 TaxID=159183 RepID=A0A6F8X097_9VIRU|nr:hypothetical protein LDVICp178 [lymphocystis disease virus-China]AAU11022.1 hypothetical protein [lymphocystis disease virus-China]BCB67518.1 hypothetical protein [Lymphocystis disease virus 2]
MDLSILPLEIRIVILSKLSSKILWNLELSNRLYWLIYKETSPSIKWDSKIVWKFKLFPPHTFQVEGNLFVYSISDLIFETYLYFETREKTFFKPVLFGKKGYFIKTLDKDIIWRNWYTVYHSKDDEFLTGTYRKKTMKRQLNYVKKILQEIATAPFPWILKMLEHGIIHKYNKIIHQSLPILFFSSEELKIDCFQMTDQSIHEQITIWNLIDCTGIRKGIAVLQPEFYNMFGNVVGLAEYKNSDQKTQALGQFNPCHIDAQPRYISHRYIKENVTDEFLSDSESLVDFWSSDSSFSYWDSEEDSDFF